MKFQCPTPGCENIFKVADEMAGKKGQCPNCGKTFTIPTPKPKPKAAGPKKKTGTDSSIQRPTKPAAKKRPPKKAPPQASAGTTEFLDDELDDDDIFGDAPPKKSPQRPAAPRNDDDDLFGDAPPKKSSQRPAKSRSDDDDLFGDPAPARSSRRQSQSRQTDDDDLFGAEDEFDDDDMFDDEPRRSRPQRSQSRRGGRSGGGSRSGGGGGRRASRREAEDLYEDDDYDDPVDDFGAPPSRRGGRKTSWKWTRVGLLILAISTCVLAGSHVLHVIGQIAGQGAVFTISSQQRSERSLNERREEIMEGDGDLFAKMQRVRDELGDEMEEVAENRRDAMETFGSMLEVTAVILKIAYGLQYAAMVAWFVAVVFLCIAPSKNGVMGMAIAIASVALINLVVMGIWENFSFIAEGESYHGHPLAQIMGEYPKSSLSGIRVTAIGADFPRMPGGTSHAILALALNTMYATQFLLLSIYMFCLAKAIKDRAQQGDSIKIMGIAIALMVMKLFFYIFAMVGWSRGYDPSEDSAWSFYVTRLFGWGADILFGVLLVILILNLFYMKKRVR